MGCRIKRITRNDKAAMVVAGWTADDTRLAAQVLHDYIVKGKYADDFEGKTAVVVSKSAGGVISVSEYNQ